jgi:hypothetical protein
VHGTMDEWSRARDFAEVQKGLGEQ